MNTLKDYTLPQLTRKELTIVKRYPYFGTDAEYFLLSKGDVVPADNYLPEQVLAQPISLQYDLVQDGYLNTAVYYDGIQGEFCIVPSTCRAYAMDEVQKALKHLYDFTTKQGLDLSFDAAVPITKDTLRKARDKYRAGFGCMPSQLRRINGERQIMHLDGRTHFTRYAGLHIHLGRAFDEPSLSTFEGRLQLVKWLDIFVGLFSVLFEGDADRQRRQVYGKAGEYREKEYGIEYRTPSPVLLQHPVLFNTALVMARVAVNVAENPRLHEYFDLPEELVVEAIDNVDRDLARSLFGKIRRNLAVWGDREKDLTSDSLTLLDFILEVGSEHFFKQDLVESWWLDQSKVSFHGDLTPTLDEVVRCVLRTNYKSFEFVPERLRGIRIGAVKEFLQFYKSRKNA